MIGLLFGLFFLLLALGVPIFMTLALSSTALIVGFTNLDPIILIQRMFSGVDKLSLLAVPFFIFAANVMNQGGLAPRLLTLSLIHI